MENLKWKSPYEKLFGKPRAYQDLKVIGCLCFAANLGVPGKFEPKAIKCVLLGYTFCFKGYKLDDLQSKKKFTAEMSSFQKMLFLSKWA